MADRYEDEIDRILALLRQAAEVNRYSIRSLERKQGVSGGLTRKVLNGDMNLTFRHVLSILDALEIEWSRFFRYAYPGTEGKEAPEIALKPVLDSGSREALASREELKPSVRPAASAESKVIQAITPAEFLVELLRLLQKAGFDPLPKND